VKGIANFLFRVLRFFTLVKILHIKIYYFNTSLQVKNLKIISGTKLLNENYLFTVFVNTGLSIHTLTPDSFPDSVSVKKCRKREGLKLLSPPIALSDPRRYYCKWLKIFNLHICLWS